MKKYILEIAVFISGAVVMVFELAGSRLLSPYLGSSIFVWASLIGVILGSLSLGYYLGGRMADRRSSFKVFSLIILFSSLAIFFTLLTKDFLLNLSTIFDLDMRLKAVLISLILFAPASIFLGMASPYAVKLKLNSLVTSGRIVGNLYAISTLGSIFGTFMAGFFLIPFFGVTNIIIILAMTLILLSILLSFSNRGIKIFSMFIGLFFLSILFIPDPSLAEAGMIDRDTQYNHVRIVDYENVRYLKIEGGIHSAMFLDSNELHSEYTKYYDLALHFNSNFRKALIIGGAGYSYPKYYLENFPDRTIDVVEIDPGITKLAREYFNLKDNPNMRIFHEDGRIFLNESEEKYDAIFGDAFSSYYSLPAHLTTLEAVQHEYDMLNDGGVILVNIISAIEGEKGEFLRAEYATYKEVFSQVYLFLVNFPEEGDRTQNIILAGIKNNTQATFTNSNQVLQEYLDHLWTDDIPQDRPILTDDYAPVDYYINKIL